MRQEADYPIAPAQCQDIKNRMLEWSKPFGILFFLDNNHYASPHNRYECLLAVGARYTLMDAALIDAHQGDWLFGHIAYEYKDLTEKKLSSRHPARLHFPLLQFFCPEILCTLNKEMNCLHISSATLAPNDIYQAICNALPQADAAIPKLQLTSRINHDAYLHKIDHLRKHIAAGDCYEINFCNEAYCEQVTIDPLAVFKKLNSLSPAPFAVYYRCNNNYLLCTSPERYLQKQDNKIIAQPMKGTARRHKEEHEDERIKEQLRNDLKERAENVMITDLMRNDLARFCETGSINVDELFGIYSFPQVHQMISTVSGTIKSNTTFQQIVECSFPMGSMTGAPKIKVMDLIEEYEESRRELFSGSIVYIDPQGNFDANVVIRSLFYNADTRYLSYQTGGAITYDSQAEKEWEELRLKAQAMERIFL